MDKYKAKFIVLEGIDNTGKSTTAQKLKEHYESLGKKVKLYHEAYKFASFDVHKIIKNLEASGNTVPDFAVLNLMIASREISIENILIPALKDCDVVIADRYYYSTYAYQYNTIHKYDYYVYLSEVNDSYQQPDKVIFFKISDLDNYQNSKKDRFEIQDLTKFKEIQEDYSITFDYEENEFILKPNQLTTIEVDQNKQPYFNFNQVLQALEGI